ncbi:CobW family GTP-binding protein [Oceanibium sediminis]|uniref:CobW family GTP-binding protein n=1 Tax=Oceanibium sediminis TaxID=2026339 RepID=UPI001E36C529|nr:GTP-binding protein [Oceanibium sediminis]
MFGSTRIPVVLLTGHLGSGKTTLLNDYLSTPGVEPALVIVNEFGEVGLDHQLMRQTSENVVLLENGCICCSVRGDLVEALKGLHDDLRAGRIEPFSRVVIETTGLADPVPVVHGMMNDFQVMLAFELTGIVTLVDAVNGASVLERYAEAGRQVALADRICITKADIAKGDALEMLRANLQRLNPGAEIMLRSLDRVDRQLFETRTDGAADRLDPEFWLSRAKSSVQSLHGGGGNIGSTAILRDAPVTWDTVSGWIDRLVAAHGPNLLRVKGLLNIEGAERPSVIHGIQHLFHPPEELADWPSEDRRTRIVCISDGVPAEEIHALFAEAEAEGERLPA